MGLGRRGDSGSWGHRCGAVTAGRSARIERFSAPRVRTPPRPPGPGPLWRRIARRSTPIAGSFAIGALGEHEGRALVESDRVAGLHLAPLPQLDLAVDADETVGDERLGLAAALRATGQLEDLGEV